MKICWLSPLNLRSAIARFSTNIIAELTALGHFVTPISIEVGDSSALSLRAGAINAIKWNSDAARLALDSADHIIINFGDHFGFHGGCLEALRKYSCIGIFHDWHLSGFLHGWIHAEGEDSVNYEINRDLSWINASSNASIDLTSWLAYKIKGAIVHSNFYGPRISKFCMGPVSKIALAYPLDYTVGPPRPFDSGRMNLLTLGWINPNKRVESVIRAICSSRVLRDSIAYTVAGPIQPDEKVRLEEIAIDEKYAGLRLLGEVRDDELPGLFSNSDLVCCLRWPAMEGASASTIEAMQSGRPVIVTDTAFYAELPDEYVFKINPEQEISDLRRILEDVLRNPHDSFTRGSLAASWAIGEFSSSRYAQRLVDFLTETASIHPAIEAARGMGVEIGSLGLNSDDPLALRVADAFDGLLAET